MRRAAIRVARADDTPVVRSLLGRAYDEHLAVFPPAIAAAYRDDLSNIAERATTSTLLVAELRGVLVGCVTHIHDASDDAHPWPIGGAVLRLLAVDPTCRRRGVGTALAAASIALARADGRAYVALHTAPSMVVAQRIYTRLGFERAPGHDFDPAAHYGGQLSDADGLWGLAYTLTLT